MKTPANRIAQVDPFARWLGFKPERAETEALNRRINTLIMRGLSAADATAQATAEGTQ